MLFEYNPLTRYKDISEEEFSIKLSGLSRFNAGFAQEVYMRAASKLASESDISEDQARYIFVTKTLELSKLCFANGLASESDGFLSVSLSPESEYDKQIRYNAEWRKYKALSEYCTENGLW